MPTLVITIIYITSAFYQHPNLWVREWVSEWVCRCRGSTYETDTCQVTNYKHPVFRHPELILRSYHSGFSFPTSHSTWSGNVTRQDIYAHVTFRQDFQSHSSSLDISRGSRVWKAVLLPSSHRALTGPCPPWTLKQPPVCSQGRTSQPLSLGPADDGVGHYGQRSLWVIMPGTWWCLVVGHESSSEWR